MIRALALAAFASLACPAFAFDPAGWAWHCEVPSEGAAPGFVRLALTPEILDRSDPALRDLRLVDDTGQLVPYVVHRARATDETRLTWQEVRLVNRVVRPGEYTRVVLDFGKPVEKNRIQVDLSGDRFCLRVRIEGGMSSQSWDTVLDNAWLVRLAEGDTGFERDIIAFPTNTFRYLRITVYAADNGSSTRDIRSARAAFARVAPAEELLPAQVTVTKVEHDGERKQSIYELDLGYRHLAVVRLDIPFDEAYFHRGYELLGRNALTQPGKGYTALDPAERKVPWQPIDRGVVYRIQEEGEVFDSRPLESLDAPYRYLQLRVHNADNPPLNLLRPVTAYRREVSLVFDFDSVRRYGLYCGNPEAQAPTFDLAQAVVGVAERDLPALQPGALTQLQPTGPDLPWTERHIVIIWIALAAAVAALLALIAANLKRVHSA